MDKQIDRKIAEFKALLKELRKQLLDASMHFEIWEELWPTNQVVDVIKRYLTQSECIATQKLLTGTHSKWRLENLCCLAIANEC